MRANLREKLRRSLFLKILAVFLVANAAIIAVATSADDLLMRRGHFDHARRNKVNWSRFLVSHLGVPPDTARAQELADNLGIQIRFESAELTWVSHPGMIAFGELAIPPYRDDPNVRAGWQEGVGLCVDLAEPGGRYLFVLRAEREELSAAFALYNAVIVAFATLVIVGVYFAIRWLLRPVRELSRGVEEVSRGNLDYAVPSRRRDELGELVRSFNAMTRRIKEMLHARKQLLLGVSHELRSPLTRARVALEFLGNGAATQNIREELREICLLYTSDAADEN